jgi:hypothetical protein
VPRACPAGPYARGEIDAEEYRRRQVVLRERHDQWPAIDEPAVASFCNIWPISSVPGAGSPGRRPAALPAGVRAMKSEPGLRSGATSVDGRPVTRALTRTTADLSSYPDLVVICLGMRVNAPGGLRTLMSFGSKIRKSVEAQPDGLLLHENLMFSLVPPHAGMRQYWRDFSQIRVAAPSGRLRSHGWRL